MRNSVTLAMLLVVSVALAPVGTVAAPTAAGATDGSTVRATNGGVATAECSFPVEYEDATGTTVRVAEDPETVVTLAPSAAQTMWEIGARDEVVGVSQFATYLDGAEEKANVSAPGYGNYRVERIVELDPDLVLAPNVVGNETVQQLREAGLTVVKFEAATSIEDVRGKTTLIGELTGNCEGAEETNRWMDRNLQSVRDAVEGRERPRVVYVFGTYTAGQSTFIDDVIDAAGGVNVVSEAGVTGYKPVNKEVVAERNPEWIVVNDPGAKERIPSTAPYNDTIAGKEGNVVVIDPNFVNQPAPRSVVYAVRNLTAAFHGEAYGSADYVSRSEVETTTTTTTESTTTTETTTTAAGGDDGTTATTATTTTSASTPGFGAGLAAVALLAVALFVRRRR